MTLLTAAFLIGIFIGLRFAVFMVVPATLGLVLLWCTGATAIFEHGSGTVVNLILAVAALQSGYVVGLTASEYFGRFQSHSGSAQSKV